MKMNLLSKWTKTLLLFMLVIVGFGFGLNNIIAAQDNFSDYQTGNEIILAQNNNPDGLGALNDPANPAGRGALNNRPIFENPLGDVNNFQTLLYRIFDAVIKLALVFVVFMIIYSGFLFVSAQGSSDGITKATKTFTYTIIGGVILLGAMSISGVICNTVNQFLDPGQQINCSPNP